MRACATSGCLHLDAWSCQGFGKASGGIRPISLFEAAYKLATGVMLDMSQAKICRILRPWQFGCNLPAGAEQMTQILRTIAQRATQHSSLQLDIPVKKSFSPPMSKMPLGRYPEIKFCMLSSNMLLSSSLCCWPRGVPGRLPSTYLLAKDRRLPLVCVMGSSRVNA